MRVENNDRRNHSHSHHYPYLRGSWVGSIFGDEGLKMRYIVTDSDGKVKGNYELETHANGSLMSNPTYIKHSESEVPQWVCNGNAIREKDGTYVRFQTKDN